MKISVNSPGRDARARQKREYKMNWHKKFAWMPTIVDETETSYAVVWGEIYMRRMLDPNREIRPHWEKRRKGPRWDRRSKTEYLKQKLANTLPPLQKENTWGEEAMAAPTTNSAAQMGQIGKAAGRVLKFNGVTYNWTIPDDLDQ